MVLFCEQQASVLKTLAVKRIGVLEDLANTVDSDVLSKDLLTLLFERRHVETIGQLIVNEKGVNKGVGGTYREELVDVFGLHLDRV